MPDIEPGSPWENPFVESFNGRVRDELLNLENFATLAEAQVIVEAWRVEYNTQRPHSALGGLTPDEYARRYGTPGHGRGCVCGQGVPVVISPRSSPGPSRVVDYSGRR